MILWSKGLGKLVLNLRLSERSAMNGREQQVVIDGTMGAPTFWDYSVNLSERDVVDFIDFLKNPVPVRFLVQAPKRRSIALAAVGGIAFFLSRTLYRFLGGRAVAAVPAAASGTIAANTQRDGSENGGS